MVADSYRWSQIETVWNNLKQIETTWNNMIYRFNILNALKTYPIILSSVYFAGIPTSIYSYRIYIDRSAYTSVSMTDSAFF